MITNFTAMTFLWCLYCDIIKLESSAFSHLANTRNILFPLSNYKHPWSQFTVAHLPQFHGTWDRRPDSRFLSTAGSFQTFACALLVMFKGALMISSHRYLGQDFQFNQSLIFLDVVLIASYRIRNHVFISFNLSRHNLWWTIHFVEGRHRYPQPPVLSNSAKCRVFSWVVNTQIRYARMMNSD